MKYNIDYFLSKFELINDYLIGCTTLNNHCALWHCGVKEYNTYNEKGESIPNHTEESESLAKILINHPYNKHMKYKSNPDLFECVWTINDIADELGSTPKERILNALKEVKELHPEL